MSGLTLMIVSWLVVTVWIAFVIFTNRKVHPKALFLLFFAEFWERFSYYGMRALLILYMTKGLQYDDKLAIHTYAAYGAMVYATPILGGWLAEKVLGYRKAIIWGGVLMAAGHFAMAVETKFVFFMALGLLIMGNGFFKPNISAFVSTFYEKNDPRKDSAFTLFYMGINAGALLTPLTCGYLGETYGWHIGFGLAGVGMVVGLVVFLLGQKMGVFGDNGHPAETADTSKAMVVYAGSLVLVAPIMALIEYNAILQYAVPALAAGMVGYLVYLGFTEEDRQVGQRLWVIVVLFSFTTLFWTFFELAGNAITLYTARNVDMGENLTASMFQSVNPAFILLFAAAVGWVWKTLDDKGMNPPAPLKFSIGLFLLGIGFFMFKFGEGFAVDGLVPVMWLILAYLFHTLGELALSPVGLSLVTKLSPARMVSFVMGIWFLSSSVAHELGAIVASFTVVKAPDPGLTDKEALEVSLHLYTSVFTNVGAVACGAAVLLLVLSFPLNKWMHGIR